MENAWMTDKERLKPSPRDMHAKVEPVVAKVERFTATATVPFTDAEVQKIRSDRELLHGSVWAKLRRHVHAALRSLAGTPKS